jgi:protein involved in polysaccharide export with SLBB domain
MLFKNKFSNIFLILLVSTNLYAQLNILPKSVQKIIKEKNIDSSIINSMDLSADEITKTIKKESIPINNDSKQDDINIEKEIFDRDKSNNPLFEQKNTDEGTSQIEFADTKNNENIIKENIIANLNDNYFGYSVFKNNPEIFQQSTDFSVDPNYVVGFGDEIIVMLWGETELYDNYTVSKDGYIFITNVGQIFVNGLTIEKIEAKLLKNLRQVYSTLGFEGENASTQLDVTLGKSAIRPLRVFALGDFESPGAYEVKSSTTLFTSLYYFDGPSVRGSLRDVHLLRNGKKIKNIDFYQYLLSGKQKGDKKLQRDDVVFIPNRGKTVSVIGEIARPLIFEMKKGEGLKELIAFAGGILTTTYTKRVQIERILTPEMRLEKGFDKTLIDVDLTKVLNGEQNIKLVDGDVINFFKISNSMSNIVSIEGAVSRPGDYDLGNGLNISELIDNAEGLTFDAFKDRAIISRFNEKGYYNQIVVDLNFEVAENNKNRTYLKSGDVLKVEFLSNLIFKSNLAITGHVKRPGVRAFKDSLKLIDLVYDGGGFENQKWINDTYMPRAELFRLDPLSLDRYLIDFNLDSVLSNKGLFKLELFRGDSIHIYSNREIKGESSKYVRISGFVKFPKDYVYTTGMKLSDLLYSAGVVDDKSFIKDVYLQRADLIRYSDFGSKQTIKSFNFQNLIEKKDLTDDFELNPGDLIRVYPKNINGEKFDLKISGSVKNPGEYLYFKEMKLSDLLLAAGGFSIESGKYRVDIIRRLDNLKNDRTTISRYIDDTDSIFNFKNDIPLKIGDILFVRLDKELIGGELKFVEISGEVVYPGNYPITESTKSISEFISAAGGLTSKAYPFSSRLIRNGEEIRLSFDKLIKNPNSSTNFFVSEGDKLIIGNKPEIIKITGNVRNPGNYQYLKGKRVRDYISFAGGRSRDGSLGEITMLGPDGKSKNISPFSIISPRVKDGSIINIGSKEVVEKFSITQYVVALTDIYADLAQALILINLSKSN